MPALPLPRLRAMPRRRGASRSVVLARGIAVLGERERALGDQRRWHGAEVAPRSRRVEASAGTAAPWTACASAVGAAGVGVGGWLDGWLVPWALVVAGFAA
ncbi:hypothetical protein Thiofri_02529 [Thiorhodovibrio frisius]|nr:hypothetical protein Thiofri_02529 [Thiorhodovibrio frisius]